MPGLTQHQAVTYRFTRTPARTIAKVTARSPGRRHDVEVEEQAGYAELIRGNANFRRLWVGNVVSLLGDWFNTIALYSLVGELTGSPFALGAVFITKMLPAAVASPVAGVIVDRFNRRHLMIASDLLRAVIVLGLLFVDEAGDVYLVYLLTTAQVVISAVFQPSQSASVPNITTPRELLTANALMSATWSVMLAAGAALGGLAAEWLGTKMVFVVDSLTYLVSASFILRCVIPQRTDAPPRGAVVKTAIREIVDGWTHLRAVPRVGRIALAKSVWAVAGGGLVFMLTLLGEQLSPQATALGIGVLFSVRGLGTGVGPVFARAFFLDRRKWPAVLGLCVVFSGLMYGFVGVVPWSYWLAALILLAHASSGVNWVLSTVMLQKRTEDRLRGRVFATEWLLLMLADTVSILTASMLLEHGILDLRGTFLAFGALQLATGLLWTVVIVPMERRDPTA